MEATLEATLQLLGKIGYEATNTTRIADRAGISIGSLYQYFRNRDEIIAELQRRHHEQTSAILEGAFADARHMDLETAVRRLIQATVDLHKCNPELHRVLTEIVPPSVNVESRALMSSRIDAAQTSWFLEVTGRSALSEVDCVMLVVREAVEGSIHRAVLHGDPDLVDRVAEEVGTMVVAYLSSQSLGRLHLPAKTNNGLA